MLALPLRCCVSCRVGRRVVVVAREADLLDDYVQDYCHQRSHVQAPEALNELWDRGVNEARVARAGRTDGGREGGREGGRREGGREFVNKRTPERAARRGRLQPYVLVCTWPSVARVRLLFNWHNKKVYR